MLYAFIFTVYYYLYIVYDVINCFTHRFNIKTVIIVYKTIILHSYIQLKYINTF